MWEQLTFWSEEPPAKTCPSPAKEQASKEQEAPSRLTLSDWLMNRNVNTSSGKTFPAYSAPTGEEISLPFYPCSSDTTSNLQGGGGRLPASRRTSALTDTASRGECWTRSLPEFPAFRSPFPNADGVSSLSDVLETGNVPPQYFLSQTACRGILHRASKRGKSLPEILEKALLRQSECAQDARGGGKGALIGDNLSHTLATGNDQTVVEFAQDVANTVEASCYKGPAGTWNERTIVSQYGNCAGTLTARHDSSPAADRGQNIVASFMGGQGAKAGSIAYQDELAPSIKACPSGGNQVPDVMVSANGAVLSAEKFWNGEDVAGTVTCSSNNALEPDKGRLQAVVAYEHHPQDSRLKETEVGPTCGTFGNSIEGKDCIVQSINCQGGNNVNIQNETTETITAASNSSGNNLLGVMNRSTVRRLLPVETERLMSFPDNHTRIEWNEKSADECPDAPRYKACGNSMCVNVMEWIGRRIEEYDE